MDIFPERYIPYRRKMHCYTRKGCLGKAAKGGWMLEDLIATHKENYFSIGHGSGFSKTFD